MMTTLDAVANRPWRPKVEAAMVPFLSNRAREDTYPLLANSSRDPQDDFFSVENLYRFRSLARMNRGCDFLF
jgi:hypothetical protein